MSMLLLPVLAHVLALVLIVALPVWDRFETRRLKTSCDPRVKVQSYQMTIAWLWICAVIAMVGFGWNSLWTIHWKAGEIPGVPSGVDARPYGIAMGLAFIAASLFPAVAARISPRFREAFAQQLAGLSFFLPRTAQQRLWFALVSISAGVCEEILFRGFLIRYFQEGPYHFVLALAVLVSCLFFGTAHFYQGPVGVLQTAFLGLVFAALFLATGSLTLPALAHVATDLKILFILRRDA